MHPLAAPLPKRLRDVAEAAKCHIVQSGDLDHNNCGILAVVGQALHHRTEERLGQARRAVKGFLNGQCSCALGAFDLIPQLVEEQRRIPPVVAVSWPDRTRFRAPGQATSSTHGVNGEDRADPPWSV